MSDIKANYRHPSLALPRSPTQSTPSATYDPYWYVIHIDIYDASAIYGSY